MITTPLVSITQRQANVTDTGDQTDIAITDIGFGRFIVTWSEVTGGPIGLTGGYDIIGQIFDHGGNRIGIEFQVNATFTGDDEALPSLARRPDGGFVMVYVDTNGLGASIRAETRDINGTIVASAPTTIQADTGLDTLANPSIAMRPDGSYLVAYNRTVALDTFPDIVGRIVSAGGVVGAEFTIIDTTDSALKPETAVLSNGNYVIVYSKADDVTLLDFDPRFDIRDANGTQVTSATIDAGANMQTDVHVAALAGGGFVAVWTEANIDGSGDGIRARLYNNAGGAIGAAFTVNGNTTGAQDQPAVVALKDGGFVVAWNDHNLDLIQAHRFDAGGAAIGSEFTAGDSGTETGTAISLLEDGRFVVGFTQTSGDDDVWTTVFSPEERRSDFNFDLRSDILMRNDDGTVAIWDMNGALVTGMHTFAGATLDWHLQGAGDLNGDGASDLLWRQDSGQVGSWHMSSAGLVQTQTFGYQPLDWHIVETGAFNDDATTDILWRHDNGTVGVWFMHGASAPTTQALTVAAPLDWHIEDTGDFNGDGRDDILWRHDNGTVGIWFIDGATVTATKTFGGAPNGWHIEGVGDFNGDGRDDILWRNDDGTVGTWEMDGLNVVQGRTFAAQPLDWHIVGTGDFNADGTDDMLWRRDDGTLGTWHMAGGDVLSTQLVGPLPGWQVYNSEFQLV